MILMTGGTGGAYGTQNDGRFVLSRLDERFSGRSGGSCPMVGALMRLLPTAGTSGKFLYYTRPPVHTDATLELQLDMKNEV